MHLRLSSLTAFVLMALCFSCGSSGPSRPDEMAELKKQINELQKVMTNHTAQIEQLTQALHGQGATISLPRKTAPLPDAPPGSTPVAMDKIDTSSEPVGSNITVAPPKAESVAESKDSPNEPMGFQMSMTDQWTADQLFQAGYRIKGTNGGQASILFARMIKRFPDSPLADNALFWLGMIQLSSGSVQKAVIFWDKILRDYPQSNKVPEALYRMAVGYRQMEQPDKAKQALERLKHDYRNSPAAQLAMKLEATP